MIRSAGNEGLNFLVGGTRLRLPSPWLQQMGPQLSLSTPKRNPKEPCKTHGGFMLSAREWHSYF